MPLLHQEPEPEPAAEVESRLKTDQLSNIALRIQLQAYLN